MKWCVLVLPSWYMFSAAASTSKHVCDEVYDGPWLSASSVDC